MSNAFEVTVDDVLNVLHSRFGEKLKGESVIVLFEELDQFAIESAALYGNDINEQTNLAYDEIEKQIKTLRGNRLKRDNIWKMISAV